MKINEYNQMMAYLTKPDKNPVTPERKPKKSTREAYKEYLEIRPFLDAESQMFIEKELGFAMGGSVETPKRGLVDEPGSYAGENQFTGPGKLRKDIIDAYKTLGKGKKTTTEDIYNYLTKKKNYTKKRELLKRNISDNLNKENLKYTKDFKKELRSEIQYQRRKSAKVKVPTPVYQKGSQSRIIEKVLFPETGPRSKENFVKELKKFFSTPKDDAVLKTKKDKIIKKFFPNGVSETTFDRVYRHVAKKENIDTTRPLKFTDEAAKQRDLYKQKKEFQKKFSDVKKEGEFLKAKKGSGLDLAHKLSKETSKRFGLLQTTGTQGIQQPVINQAIVKQYEKRLDVLYDLQEKLIKSKPKDVAKKLDLVNRMVTSVVEDSGNRIVGVVVDEKTLKPKLYGNLSGAKDTIDSGVFNKKIKNLTNKDMDFITKVLIPESIKNQAVIGKDISDMRNIDQEELIKGLQRSEKVGKPLIKETKDLLKKFPEATKEVGPLGFDTKKKDILNKYLGALGCPDKFSKFAMGGRIGFQTGATPTAQCIARGAEKINFGNIKPGAEARNATKFLKGAYRLGKNVVKFGVIPEAMYVTGESLFRMGLGDTKEEAFNRATDFLRPGDQTEKANILRDIRTLNP